MLIVDEFLKLNRENENLLTSGRDRLLGIFNALSEIYNYQHSIILCSDFMNSGEYRETFQKITKAVHKDVGILERIRTTIPESRRHTPGSLEYPIHELACVRYLSER